MWRCVCVVVVGAIGPRLAAAECKGAPSCGNADSALAANEQPPGPDPSRALAGGVAWSVSAGLGLSISAFNLAPVFSQRASLGGYLSSSPRRALSLEVVESFHLVADRTTPQYGQLGVGLRHLSRPERPPFGSPGKTTMFQRISVGAAYSFDGYRASLGFATGFSVAYLTGRRGGVSLEATAYVFDHSNLRGNSVVAVELSYVISPLVDRPPRQPRTFPTIRPSELDGPCQDPTEYRAQLRALRRRYVEHCSKVESRWCADQRSRIAALNTRLRTCPETSVPGEKGSP